MKIIGYYLEDTDYEWEITKGALKGDEYVSVGGYLLTIFYDGDVIYNRHKEDNDFECA